MIRPMASRVGLSAEWLCLSALAGMLCAAGTACAQDQVRVEQAGVPQYGAFEARVSLDKDLPDPWAVTADQLGMQVAAPDGQQFHVAAFRTQDYEVKREDRVADRKSVRYLKIYVSDADWRGVRDLTVLLDDVRLIDAKTGKATVIGDFENGAGEWSGAGCPVAVTEGQSASGKHALMLKVQFGDQPSWPGATLQAAGADWTPFSELRFKALLESGAHAGPIYAEYVNTAGMKVQPEGTLRGRLEPGKWCEIVWRLPAPGEDVKAEPEAVGAPYYAVRFMPEQVGSHRYAITRGETTLKEGTFDCVPGEVGAPVRVSKRDPFYFETIEGKPYLAIGENVCWYGRGRTADYDRWFDAMAKAGCDYCRIWMPSWAFGIEWDQLGQYRLDRAWELDYVLDLARKRGIYVMLCLDYHGAFRVHQGMWPENPYNKARGGPCAEPIDFFRDPRAEDFYRQRLRYLVARYASYSNLLSWELCNEVNLIEGYQSDVVTPWHAEMAGCLHKTDPYHHLVTTSFGGPQGDPAIWKLPEINYVQSHDYRDTDWAVNAADWVRTQRELYGKPMLFGEFGISTGGAQEVRSDPQGIYLHNGLWASVMAGGAGSAMTWWWDSYVQPLDLYHHFRSISLFCQGIAWTEGFRPLADTALSWKDGKPRRMGQTVLFESRNVSWSAAPFNQPQTLHIDAAGKLDRPELLSGLLHGVTNHPDLHNPQTFDVDIAGPARFDVGVHGVSGYGGAALVINVDGQERLRADFPSDPASTQTMHQYDKEYEVALPAGPHSVTVSSDGKDWIEVDYAIRGEWLREAPPADVWGLQGPDDLLMWVRNSEFTWANVARFGVQPATLQDVAVALPDMPAGQYEVMFWDSWQGKQIGRERLSNPGRTKLVLPAFTQAVAVHIRRQAP